MKKLSIFIISALAFIACQNNSYKIDGTTPEEFNGKTARLVDNNTNEIIDSCVIENNKFTFTGEIQKPQIYRIHVDRYHDIALAEPGSNVQMDITTATVTDNGGANDLKNKFMQSYNEFIQEKSSTLKKMIADSLPRTEIDAFRKELSAEVKNMYNQCVSDNKDNIFGAFMLASIAQDFYTDLASLDSAINAVKYAADITFLQDVRKKLSLKENTKEGNPFVDFKGKGIDGNEVALSDFVGKGKYVIVDFWASWCGPCRGEIPNLIAVNKEFGGDQFEVLGVNVWDSEQKFHESLKSEGIDYAQIYVPENVNATELYGINGIPQIMLIGPDGTIIKRDLRGEGIKAAVKEALGK